MLSLVTEVILAGQTKVPYKAILCTVRGPYCASAFIAPLKDLTTVLSILAMHLKVLLLTKA